jgi:hypothetical protein
MLCILNSQKKMDIYTTPNLPNKKRVVIHPATLQKYQKKLFPPLNPSKPQKR